MLELRHFITNVSECGCFAHERHTFIFQDVCVLRSYLFGVAVWKLVSLCETSRKVILKSHGSFINICRDCRVRFPSGRAVLISHLNSVSLWLHTMCKQQINLRKTTCLKTPGSCWAPAETTGFTGRFRISQHGYAESRSVCGWERSRWCSRGLQQTETSKHPLLELQL